MSVRNRTLAKGVYATLTIAGLAYAIPTIGARWMLSTTRERLEVWWATR